MIITVYKDLETRRKYREKNRERINEYNREWRKRNPEKVKEYYKRYRERHHQEILARQKISRNDPEKRRKKKEYMKKWYQKNRDRVLEREKEWRRKNQEKLKEYEKRRYPERKEKSRINTITFKNKTIHGVRKRAYPSNHCCELCGQRKERLEYHHWDDSDIEKGKFVKGLWICHLCHKSYTLIELNPDYPNIFKKYLRLKKKINEEHQI